jgi:catechol 2,3-dioxygenase-like lactoylglutathione lyase family enzyme
MGWTMSALVPELLVSDIATSRTFYLDVLGFSVMWERPAEKFLYLGREGAELMLEQPTHGRHFLAGKLEHPYGRGMNLQIKVSAVDALHDSVIRSGAPIYLPMEEKWYRTGDHFSGNRQFIVSDPDGYLLRFFEDLGSR